MPGPVRDVWETPRLRAERLCSDHFDFIFSMHQHKAVMQHQGGLRSRHRTRRYLEHNLTHWCDHGCGIWVLFAKDSNQPVGRGGLRHTQLAARPEVELAYALMPEFWGQGLATEFARSAVNLGLHGMALTSITAVVDPQNRASARVVEKVGFEFDHEILYSGRQHRLYRCSVRKEIS